MVNKKKGKSAAKSKIEHQEKPSDSNAASSVSHPSARSGLSSAQFCGLVFLFVGLTYLMEFRAVLDSKACDEYLMQNAADAHGYKIQCSENDFLMVRAKYNSGILAEVIVAFCILLCWKDDAVLHRLNALLCSSPLFTTLVAMQSTKSVVDNGQLFKLAMLVTVLLILATASIYSAQHVSSRLPLTLDLQNATLATIAFAYSWEAYKFLIAGVSGFLKVTDTTPASVALLPFLAVDQSTIVGMCFFGIAFLGDVKKRVSGDHIELISPSVWLSSPIHVAFPDTTPVFGRLSIWLPSLSLSPYS